jgi:hypothetical protein
MKKLTIPLVVLIILLNACTSTSNSAESALNQRNESESAAPSAESTQISKTDQLLADYLAGKEIDTSDLNPVEFKEFSSKLAEKLNADRGINPVVYNNEAYISPDNFMMMTYDGHADQNETITMFHPIEGFDAVGNLQVNMNGIVTTIENSADMDWNQRVTDPKDPNFNWPKTEVYSAGYTEAQGRVEKGFEIFPAILLSKDSGIVYLEEFGEKSLYPFLTIISDSTGKPILAREFLAFAGPKFYLQEEGSSFTTVSSISIEQTYLDFYKNLSENSVYYLAGLADQEYFYDALQLHLNGYTGIVDVGDVYPVLDYKTTNNKDMLLLMNTLLIKRTEQEASKLK